MSSYIFQSDPVNVWAYWENAFTPEECARIIQAGSARTIIDATITTEVNANQLEINESYRKNQISWLPTNDRELVWFYEKMSHIIKQMNIEFFKFDLHGFTEDMQFTKYNASGDNYKMHIDKIYTGLIRKLTAVIQLSDPKDYDGCELELYTKYTPDVMKKEQGTIILFPSYTVHQVTPLTRGTRYSLVSWVSGSPFK